MQARSKVGVAVLVALVLVGGALAIRLRRPDPRDATIVTAPSGSARAQAPESGSGARDGSAARGSSWRAQAGANRDPRQRPGITMGAPGSLATIPDRYELGAIGNDEVAVRFAGGPPTIYSPLDFRASDPPRTVHGHVVGTDGAPVAGAIVLVDKQLWLNAGNLSAHGGAVSDASGAFEIADAPIGDVFAIAFDPTGWSQLARVGTDPLELRLAGRGALHGRLTYDGHGESFLIDLKQEPAHVLWIDYETDPDGRFAIASLPPGSYHLAAGLAQPITGGDSHRTERTITITAGQTTDVDIAQTSGTIVVLTAHDVPGAAHSYFRYWLFSGAAPPDLATAKARAVKEHPQYILYGGVDTETPAQIHDVAAGSYAGCAATDTGAFGCTPVVVLDGDDVREVAIQLAR